jgi:release factor glutamine methyltransferase
MRSTTNSNEAVQFPTPNLDHFNRADYKRFYEPSEDSFLLIDALVKDREFLKELNPKFCVEIGTGSGVVIVFLAQLLNKIFQGTNYSSFQKNSQRIERLFLGTDLNMEACKATQLTSEANHVIVESICTRFLNGIEQRCAGQIDLLLFNPPYVPTTIEEANESQLKGEVSAAWAGGENGTHTLRVLLPQVPVCHKILRIKLNGRILSYFFKTFLGTFIGKRVYVFSRSSPK